MNNWKNHPPESYGSLPQSSSNGTILLVDDEPLVRVMTGAVLTAMGWSVLNVSSSEDAVQMLRHMRQRDTQVDMVILDLILPSGMSGLDAVRHLREVQPGVRILACSGFFGDETGTSCLDMGFNAVLAKPFSAEDLAQAVFQCMHSSEMQAPGALVSA
jgi:CheY-like chemotaxis protein